MQTYIKNPKIANFLHYFRFTLTRAYVNVFLTKNIHHTPFTGYYIILQVLTKSEAVFILHLSATFLSYPTPLTAFSGCFFAKNKDQKLAYLKKISYLCSINNMENTASTQGCKLH